MKRLVCGVSGLLLLLLCVFFGVITLYVARTEVWPSIQAGSLDVDTDTMILNVLWEGNEIYLLLFFYLVLTVGFAFGAYRLLVAAVGRG